MNEPSITVLMAVYHGDCLDHFTLALDSVFSQTLLPDQIVVVVDGPVKPEIDKYLDDMKKCHICLDVIRLEKNLGLPEALNYGLQFVKFNWIARFDADDLMVANRLELQRDFLLKNNVDIFGGQIREFDEGGNWCERSVPTDIISIKRLLPWRNPVNHVTAMYRTDLIKKFKYRNIKGYEDYELWFRLLNSPYVTMTNMENFLVDVRAGSQMYRRRVGFSYALGELRFRALTSKYSENLIKHWTAGVLRSIISLLPKDIKALVYLYFLRNKVK